MTDDPTVGDLVDEVRAAAPGSARIGRQVITWVGEYEFKDGRWADEQDALPAVE